MFGIEKMFPVQNEAAEVLGLDLDGLTHEQVDNKLKNLLTDMETAREVLAKDTPRLEEDLTDTERQYIHSRMKRANQDIVTIESQIARLELHKEML